MSCKTIQQNTASITLANRKCPKKLASRPASGGAPATVKIAWKKIIYLGVGIWLVAVGLAIGCGGESEPSNRVVTNRHQHWESIIADMKQELSTAKAEKRTAVAAAARIVVEVVRYERAVNGRAEPSVFVRLTNTSSVACKDVYLSCTLKSPARSVPYSGGLLAVPISGGLEPGETRSFKARVSRYADLYVADLPTDAVITATVDSAVFF